MKYTAGVNGPGLGARTPFDQAFVIRGFGNATTTSGGDYYRDGFRMIGIPISMANVERIELLKGPASVLYGRAGRVDQRCHEKAALYPVLCFGAAVRQL